MPHSFKPPFVVTYPQTNESLEAIVRGLSIVASDNVLSICGSGDQPLALLERARSVVAIDIDSDQMHYALARVEQLRNGKFWQFRNPGMSVREFLWKSIIARNERNGVVRAFFNQERLRILQQKLHHLHFCEGDIFDYLGPPNLHQGQFDKVYLSNALDLAVAGGKPDAIFKLLHIVKNSGLIYVSDDFFLRLFSKDFSGKIVLDEELTNEARETRADLLEWMPSVYRKIAV